MGPTRRHPTESAKVGDQGLIRGVPGNSVGQPPLVLGATFNAPGPVTLRCNAALGSRDELRTRLALQAPRAESGLRVWFAALDSISDRSGNPYHDAHHRDWDDNWYRFGQFSRLAAALAGGRCGVRWQADVMHCNDWQTGLVPVYGMLMRVPAASVFTIHNLQYRGLFGPECMATLGLPAWLWHPDALEFHGQLALIKGGLGFADALTTVSPTYAEEIRTPWFGHGLEGLLHARRARLTGILNGIDDACWNPATDPHLPATYGHDDMAGKAQCKHALQQEVGLHSRATAPLLGVVSRLVEQKGIDLVLAILDALIERGVQLVVLGRGEPHLEQALQRVAARYPGEVAVRLDFDEGLAHRIEAGADAFVMPSRFEPCGLNQLYSQRYGTPPIVHRSGGLADSVVEIEVA